MTKTWIVDGVKYTTEPTEMSYDELEAIADKRLELLKVCEENMERCPVCLQLLIPVGEHDGLCELARELANEQS